VDAALRITYLRKPFCEGDQAENEQAARFELVLGHNESAFLFRLIAAHIAELARSFDEAALPVGTFLNGCGLVAELIDFVSSHVGGRGGAFSASTRRGGLGIKSTFDEPADGFGPAWQIFLPAVADDEALGQPRRRKT
jgi:hypothetical protein